MAALVVLWMVVKARAGVRRARAAAGIARVGSPLSLIGRLLVTALVIVGVQWLVIAHLDNVTLRWVVLGFPALVSAYTLTNAPIATQNPSRRRAVGRR
jgi:hypothetical protein